MSPKKSHTVRVTEDQLRLLEAVEHSPELLEKFTDIFARFNQEVDGGMDAYTAERHIVDAVRGIGRSMIGQWAEKAQQTALNQALQQPDQIKNGKKKLYWYSTFGRIELRTQILRNKATNKTSLPFFIYAKLQHSNSSLLLQRRVVDFSSERSMAKAARAIQEHYGFDLPCSAITQITRKVAARAKMFNSSVDGEDQASPLLIVELDGSMVPIVEYGEANEDQRKRGLRHNRNCHWREFRLCTVSRPKQLDTYYGVVQGDPFQAGCMMHESCRKKGMNEMTHIHGVADGAPWIAEQYETQFGGNHELLMDFYHVSEYLGAASGELDTSSLPSGQSPKQWLAAAKEKLKQGRASEVIIDLDRHAANAPETSSLRSAFQYLSSRQKHLNYARALDQDLPIGSGEVESGHRSVLQARLKKPGAWWKLENAENMAHLKVMQANDHWNQFWQHSAA